MGSDRSRLTRITSHARLVRRCSVTPAIVRDSCWARPILRSLHHPNWDIEILPGADHGLFENPSDLEPDEPKATKLASGLRHLIAAWLARTVGESP